MILGNAPHFPIRPRWGRLGGVCDTPLQREPLKNTPKNDTLPYVILGNAPRFPIRPLRGRSGGVFDTPLQRVHLKNASHIQTIFWIEFLSEPTIGTSRNGGHLSEPTICLFYDGVYPQEPREGLTIVISTLKRLLRYLPDRYRFKTRLGKKGLNT